LALATVLINLVVLAVRWRLLFYPQHREQDWWDLLKSIVVSQAINTVVPGRMGELSRAYTIGTHDRMSKTHVLGTIVVEKVFDVAVLAAGVAVLWATMVPPEWAIRAGNVLLALSVAVTAVVFFAAYWSDVCLRWLEWLGRFFPPRIRVFVLEYSQMAFNGFRAIRYWRINFSIWILSFSVLILSVCTNYFLFLSFDLALLPTAALFLLIVLQVGSAPPSLPGKIGVFCYLGVLALSFFAIDRSLALAYCMALYCVSVVPKIVLAVMMIGLSPAGTTAPNRTA
jgi:glycosyltransferase 2 family protein